MKIKFKFLSLSILLFACGESPDLSNSILDTNIGGATPETTIIIEEQIYDVHTVSLTWEGDQYVNAFRYKLIPLNQTDTVTTYLDWSEWDRTTTSVILEYLDEGQYEFHVEGRFNMDHVGSAVAQFEIDAIQGETLRMFPLRQFVEIDSMFNVYLFSEEIDQLAGMQVKLNFDPDVFEYQSMDDYLGSDILNYYETNDQINIPLEVADNSITFTAALFGEGLFGSNELLKLTFKYLGSDDPGSTAISIDLTGCDSGNSADDCITFLRNPLIEPIEISGGSHASSLIKEVQ